MTDEKVPTSRLQPIHDPEGSIYAFVMRTPDYPPRKGHVEIIYRHHTAFPSFLKEYEAEEEAKLDNPETPG